MPNDQQQNEYTAVPIFDNTEEIIVPNPNDNGYNWKKCLIGGAIATTTIAATGAILYFGGPTLFAGFPAFATGIASRLRGSNPLTTFSSTTPSQDTKQPIVPSITQLQLNTDEYAQAQQRNQEMMKSIEAYRQTDEWERSQVEFEKYENEDNYENLHNNNDATDEYEGLSRLFGDNENNNIIQNPNSQKRELEKDIPTDGLILHYSFNNGNAHDESGHGNDGEVHNAELTEGRSGKPNSAYYFGHRDSCITVNNTNWAITNPITISLYFYPKKLHDNPDLAIFCPDHCINLCSFGPFEIYATEHSDGDLFDLLNDDCETKNFDISTIIKGNNMYSYNKTTPMKTNRWYHVALTSDGRTQQKTYINGKLTLQEKIIFPIDYFHRNNPFRLLQIGGSIGIDYINNHYLPNIFPVKIDDFRVYDRVLSDKEIQALYQRGPSIPLIVTCSTGGLLLIAVVVGLVVCVARQRIQTIRNRYQDLLDEPHEECPFPQESDDTPHKELHCSYELEDFTPSKHNPDHPDDPSRSDITNPCFPMPFDHSKVVIPEEFEVQHQVHKKEEQQEKTPEKNEETEREQLENPGVTDHNSERISTGMVEAEEDHKIFECPICFEWMNNAVITPYGHSYCEQCITAWINNQGTDPIGSNRLAINQLTPNYQFRETIEWFRQHNHTGVSNPVKLSVPLGEVDDHSKTSTTSTTTTLTTPFWCHVSSTSWKQHSSQSDDEEHKAPNGNPGNTLK